MQEIGYKATLNLDEILANMNKTADLIGQVDDKFKNMFKGNVVTQAAAKQKEFNQGLGAQVQIYQRVEAAANAFRAEEKKHQAQVDQLQKEYAELNKRKLEFLAAGRYAELKTALGQIENKLTEMNVPLKNAETIWDRLKAKFSTGLKVPKIDMPGMPDADEYSSGRDSNGRFKKKGGSNNDGDSSGNKKTSVKGRAVNIAKEAAGGALDEAASTVGLAVGAGPAGVAAAAVAATAGVVIKATKSWAEYGKVLSEVSSITGATGKDLVFLDQQAQAIEMDTGIAGTEILEAFKSIGSIKPELLANKELLTQTTKEVIALQQASGLSIQDSAKSLLGALNQFGEGADQAGRFANVLAAGAQEGASEINETAEALNNSGTAMKAAGLSFEQGNALVQSLAGVMIKGSEAGTALRNVLLKLETASDKNLRPSVVGIDAALENASKKFNTTTKLTTAFGVENIVAARRILDNREEITKMTTAITGTNTAYEQAKTNTNNLANDLDKAGTATTAYFRSLGQEQDGFLRKSVQAYTNFLNQLSAKNGEYRAFFRGVMKDGLSLIPVVAIARGYQEYQRQVEANKIALSRTVELNGIKKNAETGVTDETKKLQDQYKTQGEAIPKALRSAAAKVKAERDEQYNAAVADHNRLKKELERQIKENGGQDTGSLNNRFAQSRRKLLATRTAKQTADSQFNQLAKEDAERAATLQSLLNEGKSKEQIKGETKAQKIQDESNQILLDAQEEYVREYQKLETEFGKERLEALNKDGAEYINAKAELDQRALKLERDAFEKRLKLATASRTEVVAGKRQATPNGQVTLENTLPDFAKAFNDRQQQIENERQRQIELSRVRSEYNLLELGKKSNDNELAVFDKFWETKLLEEEKNSGRYGMLIRQRNAARKELEKTGGVEQLADFDEVWKQRLKKEEANAAVYIAMLAKYGRDRNTLVVDQLLKTMRDQEAIELAFLDTNRGRNQLKNESPDPNDPTARRNPAEQEIRRQEAALIIRKRYAEDTIKYLRDQGETENALLITQTEAAIDGLEDQLKQLRAFSPKNTSIYDLLGLTDGMDDIQFRVFKEGMMAIGDSIRSVTDIAIQASEERIAAIDNEINAKEEQIRIEQERSKEGFANNLLLRQRELEDLRAKKAEEEKIKRNAQKVQAALDLATTLSNNAVSISNTISAITGAAKEGIKLGPIAGPIAIVGIIATIVASLFAAKTQLQSLTKMREGGKLRGPSHEQGGIRGAGSFGDIEVEGGEHVTNARSSEKFDKTLEALNKDNPHQALSSLLKEAGITFAMPAVVVQQIQDRRLPANQTSVDLSPLKAEIRAQRQEMNEQNGMIWKMLKEITEMNGKKDLVQVAPGIYLEHSKNRTRLVDMRNELARMGVSISK